MGCGGSDVMGSGCDGSKEGRKERKGTKGRKVTKGRKGGERMKQGRKERTKGRHEGRNGGCDVSWR